MSSTERAPEPTMEEILASIRRIITDDEAGQGQAEKPAQAAQADEENLEGEADNQIIDDIARVLSGSSSSEAPASEEEEILDLTAELGGLEIVEDDAEPVAEEVTEVVEVLELEEVEAAPEFVAPPPAEEPAPDFMADQPAQEQEMTPPPEMAAPEMPAPPAMPPQTPEPAPPEPKLSAGDEAATALERAIAALRAGQVPTSTTPPAEPFHFQAAPQPEAMAAPEPEPAPEPIPMAVPMPEPEPEEETHPEPEAYFELDAEASFEAEPETAPVPEPMDEMGAEPEETVETIEIFEPEPESASFWPPQASEEQEEQPAEPEPVFEPEPEHEPVMAQMNGDAHHAEGPSRTLEDSIKDMLRPMLREWLDDNMPRIIRDELDTDALRRHQD